MDDVNSESVRKYFNCELEDETKAMLINTEAMKYLFKAKSLESEYSIKVTARNLKLAIEDFDGWISGIHIYPARSLDKKAAHQNCYKLIEELADKLTNYERFKSSEQAEEKRDKFNKKQFVITIFISVLFGLATTYLGYLQSKKSVDDLRNDVNSFKSEMIDKDNDKSFFVKPIEKPEVLNSE